MKKTIVIDDSDLSLRIENIKKYVKGTIGSGANYPSFLRPDEKKKDYFDDHGFSHCERIDRILGEFITEFTIKLNDEELYILKAAVYCHDLGMFENERDNDITGRDIRETHEKRSCSIVEKDLECEPYLKRDEVLAVNKVILAHRKKNPLDEVNDYSLEIGKINLLPIEALLRLADALDVSSKRTPKAVFGDNWRKMSEFSREEWLRKMPITSMQFIKRDGVIQLNVHLVKDPNKKRIQHELIEKTMQQIKEEINSIEPALKEFRLNLSIHAFDQKNEADLPRSDVDKTSQKVRDEPMSTKGVKEKRKEEYVPQSTKRMTLDLSKIPDIDREINNVLYRSLNKYIIPKIKELVKENDSEENERFDFLVAARIITFLHFLRNENISLDINEEEVKALKDRFNDTMGRYYVDGTYLNIVHSNRGEQEQTSTMTSLTTCCENCSHQEICLITFADTFLPAFALATDVTPDNRRFIRELLSQTALKDKNKNFIGWTKTYTQSHISEDRYDAYTSLQILDFILSHDVSQLENNDINKILLKILKGQEKEAKQDKFFSSFGISRNRKGCWPNYYWDIEEKFGEKAGQIDITSDMLRILMKIFKEYSTRINIENKEKFNDAKKLALDFVKNCYKQKLELCSGNEWNKCLLDFPPSEVFRESSEYAYRVGISDIIGTAAAIELFLEVEGEDPDFDPCSPTIFNTVEWLIEQQNEDGSWPILSEDCRDWAKNRDAITVSNGQFSLLPHNVHGNRRVNKLYGGDYKSYNKNLTDTIRVIRALVKWRNSLFNVVERGANENVLPQKYRQKSTTPYKNNLYIKNLIKNATEFCIFER